MLPMLLSAGLARRGQQDAAANGPGKLAPQTSCHPFILPKEIKPGDAVTSPGQSGTKACQSA